MQRNTLKLLQSGGTKFWGSRSFEATRVENQEMKIR